MMNKEKVGTFFSGLCGACILSAIILTVAVSAFIYYISR